MPALASRRWLVRGAVVLALALVVVVLQRTVLAPAPVAVQVTRVERGRVEQTVANSRAGTVMARRRAKLTPQEGGRVVALPFREGDRVRTGDVIVELDATVPRARLELTRREVAAADAEQNRACLAAERAARELTRNRGLAAQGIVSADLLDAVDSAARTAAASCEAAKAQAARARAAIEVAERELDHMTLRAPFDGVIAKLDIEIGEWSTPSPPVIQVPAVIDLIDPTSIYVSAPMDEVDSARLRAGMAARVGIDSFPGRHFPAHVVRVAPFVLDVEEQNRTVEIEAELDDRDLAATLLPGTSADVEVVLETRDDVLRIPSGAILTGDRVLVLDDGVLAERPVTVGLRNWDMAEVRSGLSAGDAVVVSLDRPEVRAGARATAETPAP